jgi:hypothetical protein
MTAIDIAAPGALRDAAAATQFHAQVLVERLQWISHSFNGDNMSVAAGFVAEMAGTVALIMVVVGWAESRRRRESPDKAVA